MRQMKNHLQMNSRMISLERDSNTKKILWLNPVDNSFNPDEKYYVYSVS